MVEEEESPHYSSVMDSSNYCHGKATWLKASWCQSCFYSYRYPVEKAMAAHSSTLESPSKFGLI